MSEQPQSQVITFSRLLDRAMRLLAQRDHSREELKHKLQQSVQRTAYMQQKPPETITEEQMEKVLDWCQENGWLNDERFMVRFIQSRSRKGYGPQRIRMELAQKGIDRESIDLAMEETSIDWAECAAQLAERKFGLPLPKEWKEKAKVQRFLQSKEFLTEDIQAIFRNIDDQEPM
ncbi:regulatory protein RecX [Mixta mediterraneensis]|uniref:regulatory protein RecX n=1 Tax=Mixta mediterraneensis TaxID=2758443 RepID=UPI0018757FD1|nr:regulatory protein RecX [Mixta mediterraneensis]MBE5251984.1 regulatory protein RecX [Mixta mediterraneensis]